MEKNHTEVFVWYDDLRTDLLSAGRLEVDSKFDWPARREGMVYVVGWGKGKEDWVATLANWWPK